ncbi:FadR/GntR family transcriptional regulator [Dactylosporangium siamense]|uniref:GntR family transcriptional regulator n=1 Tax=Dactylosporangium siamense TaxID=685454 RepID=A0A919UCT6_9ACTN|nr:FCD domain-containing protein [Dactylosporangium siamense]GIG50712.1 GntR family transcriptional regulator [Dactylosporangium siamense]
MTVTRTTLGDQLARGIVGKIETMGLGPGDEIPAEGELAREFGVNRLVVREAIRTLVAREILMSSQGRPARVSIPSPRVFGQILEFRLNQNSLDFDDLVDTRRVIEGELVRRAASRVKTKAASVDRGREILAEMAGAADNRDRFIELDIAFHAAIAEMAGAQLLQFILDSLEAVLLRARQASYDGRVRRGEDQKRTLRAHERILAAIAEGDADKAADAMAKHLAETARDLNPPQRKAKPAS